MSDTRAFVGAFGAGISVAIAGSLALLVISSVIAFHGWPDDLSGASEPQIAQLSGGGVSGSGSAAGAGTVSLPRAATITASARGVKGSARRGGSVRSGGPAVATTPGARATTAVTPSTSSSPAVGTPSTPKTSTTHQVSDSVRDTTASVGHTAAPISPAVGGSLQSVGAAGADTVDQVAGGLLP